MKHNYSTNSLIGRCKTLHRNQAALPPRWSKSKLEVVQLPQLRLLGKTSYRYFLVFHSYFQFPLCALNLLITTIFFPQRRIGLAGETKKAARKKTARKKVSKIDAMKPKKPPTAFFYFMYAFSLDMIVSFMYNSFELEIMYVSILFDRNGSWNL